MLNNECLKQNINQNSLKIDGELTQNARDVSIRLNRRMGEIQRKLDEMECFSKEVTLRVTNTTAKIANLKTHKPVKQLISNENLPIQIDTDYNGKPSFSSSFLNTFKTAIMESSKTINSLENPAVFTTGHVQVQMETNGFTNGHHEEITVESYEGTEESEDYRSRAESQLSSTRNEEVSEEISVPPKPSSTTSEDSEEIWKDSESLEVDGIGTAENGNGIIEIAPPISEKKVPVKSAALASVIGEMKQKVAARPKFFDSDSDSDQDLDVKSESEFRPSAGAKTETEVASKNQIINGTLAKDTNSDGIIIETKKVNVQATTSIAKTIIEKVAPPPKLTSSSERSSVNPPSPVPKVGPLPDASQKAVLPIHPDPPKPSNPIANNIKETAKPSGKPVPSSIFDSDSDSDSDFMKPIGARPARTLGVQRNAEKEPPKSSLPRPSPSPSTSKPAAPLSNSNYVESSHSNSQRPIPSTTTSAPSTVAPQKTNHVEPPNTITPQPRPSASPPSTTKPAIKKSIFSSDSDSDDDFLKSFSKSSTAKKPIIAKPVEIAPKPLPTQPTKTIPPVVVATPTAIPAVVEVPKKVEANGKKSLFDDSDSDSDLFTSASNKASLSGKPIVKSKSIVEPEMNHSPSVSAPAPTTTPPTSTPPTSTPTKPESPMAAKIALIEQMQIPFRLPGSPNIPEKSSPVTTSQEESDKNKNYSDEVGAILKTRPRGPANRRPPTRLPK